MINTFTLTETENGIIITEEESVLNRGVNIKRWSFELRDSSEKSYNELGFKISEVLRKTKLKDQGDQK